MNLMLDLVVVAATVLGSGMAYPQARKLVRTRCIEGVSAAWIGVSMALNAWWLSYAVAEHVWALAPVSATSLVLYTAIAVVFVHAGGRQRLPGVMSGIVSLGVVPMIALLLGGWPVAGLVIGLCYGLQLLPAVVEAFRGSDLAGISAGTWIIALAEAALWLVYGLAVVDPALIAGGASGLAMAALILVRLSAAGYAPIGSVVALRPAGAR
jgi:uncharacterized protein with PQ loop repeat